MNGSWSVPSNNLNVPGADALEKAPTRKVQVKPSVSSSAIIDEKYHALVVDSGAIIKHTGFSRLHNTANKYITTQGVIDEIRDSKARAHLETLPFELEVREPSAEGLTKMVEFSKKTGDYASLSAVDMHILALLYDLEKEGCSTVEHIRTEPKRALTGRVIALNKNEVKKDDTSKAIGECEEKTESEKDASPEAGEAFFQGNARAPVEHKESVAEEKQEDEVPPSSVNVAPVKKSWATLVNPSVAASVPPKADKVDVMAMASKNFGSMNLAPNNSENDDECVGGQFSDAEDDESLELQQDDNYDSSDDDGDEFASIGEDFSDEDCDVYILDPEEVGEKEADDGAVEIDEELEMEFPSLSAASTIPYAGSDDEGEQRPTNGKGNEEKLKKAAEEDRKKIEASLKPISNSGKLYNSFRGYKDIVAAGGVKIQPAKKISETSEQKKGVSFAMNPIPASDNSQQKTNTQSRVIGGTGFSGQSAEVDDDGVGWVTSAQEISTMKAMGTLDPFSNNSNRSNSMKLDENLPPKSDRAACATTDFAMQNVILQMNLELLSVDGVKVRKLKSWVTRCASCFKVYTGSDNDGKRIFCDRCGSSSLHRIAASIDGKTGRLKLHLKKNFKSRTRGTKFALPKPGSQNKYMGDLLLAEDQLMYGAWNQRVKMTRSKKEKQSIFGTEIAATVGCHQDLTKRADIKIGFGRKNPNATKSGRERRGKKKKSSDKACGVRRY